jgi:4-hydroxy-tetrahydrodipicolinate synthase
MHGVWTALVTPFRNDNELDLAAFKKILADQRAAGVAGVIPCGTTGEAPTLTCDEKKTLISTALETLDGSSTQVIAATGSNDTAQSVELSRWASQQGVQGLLVVTPYYNKPSQAGLETHYRKIADQVDCPIILYNVPGRTGVSLSSETIVSLASHPRIRALKEASGNVTFTSEIMEGLSQKKLEFNILSGDDALFLPLLSIGATGVISVASNLLPRAMVAIQRAMDNGQHTQAHSIHRAFYPLFRDLFIESNPVPIKSAMAYAGWCEPHVRLPLAPIAGPNWIRLKNSLQRCGIAPGESA